MLPQVTEIKVRRRKTGLTQMQLAKQAGVSQSLIAKIESGRIDASYSNINRIFDALETNERKTTKTAGQLSNPRLYKLSKNDRVEKAIHLMKNKNVSQLPVFDGEHPIGSVSEKTILDRITTGDEDIHSLSKMNVDEIMNESFPIVEPSTPVNAVTALLTYHSAVLVRRKQKIIGIITKADLISAV